ncbi:energy-coupling factor transport system substrate-specific component [Actinoalloteichus cyanogriseus DSM 43889]|uniref:Energy-coupling factor transport system substrate-specific component n=1 Tax=Actinoalloteichus caeruleus DSM 43889 TaxID=1120930 RepID=A0ABT1JQP2_ACTCY|nr:energy-coupling factor transport system substrate-specific component [Actinoalloteichus caeruleus DSM 43889]
MTGAGRPEVPVDDATADPAAPTGRPPGAGGDGANADGTTTGSGAGGEDGSGTPASGATAGHRRPGPRPPASREEEPAPGAGDEEVAGAPPVEARAAERRERTGGESTGLVGSGEGPVDAAAPRPTEAGPPRVVRIAPRTAVVLALASLAGFAMFFWPLFAAPEPEAMAHSADAPLIFVVVLPVLIGIVLAELSSGGIDSKALAMLGVLSAINAALRPLGAGTAGIETVFFMLVLAGRVFGPGFGFVLGSTSLFASALLTAGVGPWLPFQMLASSWVGLGAGLLPRRVRGRAEIVMLAGYGAFSAYFFGFVMNMWFWPFTAGIDTQLSFVAGDPVLENLHRFVVFTLYTSTFGWDTGRALTNVLAIALIGGAVLAVLRRAARRAAFHAPATFDRG